MAEDRYKRTIDYLRISITDRCNMRCVYCMPETGIKLLPHSEILTYEEILTVVRAASEMGINKVRLTGGEPLVRRDLPDLIEQIWMIPGITDVALTTNGMLLGEFAETLYARGLRRINVSLDTLNAERFRQITRNGDLDRVMAGIEKALEVGFDPVKINVVAVDEHIEEEIQSFLELVYARPVHVRFIEKMDIGNGCGQKGNYSCSDLIDKLKQFVNLERTDGPPGHGPAYYVQPEGASGTIGFICPYTRHFCARCNRLRITADGKVRPCLFSDAEIDLKTALRGDGSLEAVKRILNQALNQKPESYQKARHLHRRNMRQIGG